MGRFESAPVNHEIDADLQRWANEAYQDQEISYAAGEAIGTNLFVAEAINVMKRLWDPQDVAESFAKAAQEYEQEGEKHVE